MADKKSIENRRKLLKSIAAGSGTVIAGKNLPENWAKPVVDSVLLPVHAQASTPCGGLFYASPIVSACTAGPSPSTYFEVDESGSCPILVVSDSTPASSDFIQVNPFNTGNFTTIDTKISSSPANIFEQAEQDCGDASSIDYYNGTTTSPIPRSTPIPFFSRQSNPWEVSYQWANTDTTITLSNLVFRPA